MSDFFVSPRFRARELAGAAIERKIDAFEDQMRGWLLDHARLVASNPSPSGQHAGFAILGLCLVYVESIACFLRGETSDNKSREFFDVGLTAVFPDLNPGDLAAFSREFYRQVRCGLLDQGLARGKVGITKGGLLRWPCRLTLRRRCSRRSSTLGCSLPKWWPTSAATSLG